MGQPKRLGRGIGSGLGKTSGRGHKGQKARTGAAFSTLCSTSQAYRLLQSGGEQSLHCNAARCRVGFEGSPGWCSLQGAAPSWGLRAGRRRCGSGPPGGASTTRAPLPCPKAFHHATYLFVKQRWP